MNDYVLSMERRNLREVTYCHFNLKLMFMCSYERNVQASIVLSIILAMHRLFPLLEGSQLAQHASPDEANYKWCCKLCVWLLGSSLSRGPRATAPQEMDLDVGWAPALPYSLGLNSPSRHQQREEEGCNKHPDAASSDQPLEAGAMYECLLLPLLEEHVVVPCACLLERRTTSTLLWVSVYYPSYQEMEAIERGQPVPV